MKKKIVSLLILASSLCYSMDIIDAKEWPGVAMVLATTLQIIDEDEGPVFLEKMTQQRLSRSAELPHREKTEMQPVLRRSMSYLEAAMKGSYDEAGSSGE